MYYHTISLYAFQFSTLQIFRYIFFLKLFLIIFAIILSMLNFFQILLLLREKEISSLDLSSHCDRSESIDLISQIAAVASFPTSPTTCEKVLWSICCIVHQALPPSSSLTLPPEGTVTTTGPNNHQVLLTFRVSLPIFEEKKKRENLLSLPLGIGILFLFICTSLSLFPALALFPEISTICTFTPSPLLLPLPFRCFYIPHLRCAHVEGVFLRPHS